MCVFVQHKLCIVYFNVTHRRDRNHAHAELFFILMILSAAPLANSSAVLIFPIILSLMAQQGVIQREREHVQQTICRAWEAIVA